VHRASTSTHVPPLEPYDNKHDFNTPPPQGSMKVVQHLLSSSGAHEGHEG